MILFIPSRDKKNKAIANQTQWADTAAEIFARLYGGGTAFKALAGVFMTDKGEILKDEPILLESYAKRKDVTDEGKLMRLLDLALRLGKDTNQHSVAIVINDFIHYVRIKRRLLTIRKSPSRYRNLGIEISPTKKEEPHCVPVGFDVQAIEFALVRLRYMYGTSIDEILMEPSLGDEFVETVHRMGSHLSAREARLV